MAAKTEDEAVRKKKKPKQKNNGGNGGNGKKGNGGKGNGGKKGTGSECKPGRSNPGDRGEIYMVTMSGSAHGFTAPTFVKVGFTNNCRQRFGNLKAGNPFKLNCHVSYKVCKKKPAEDAAHAAISSASINMGGGEEWFYYGTSANLENMRQSVRTAIDPWIEVAGSSSDLVESSINPCLTPNQAGAIMPTNYNYGNFNPRFAGVYNAKWRQTLQGNVLQIKYNCK